MIGPNNVNKRRTWIRETKLLTSQKRERGSWRICNYNNKRSSTSFARGHFKIRTEILEKYSKVKGWEFKVLSLDWIN